MKYKCNNCGKIIVDPLTYTFKGTQYNFCNEKCDKQYEERQQELQQNMIIMSNPFIGLIITFKIIKEALYPTKNKKQ